MYIFKNSLKNLGRNKGRNLILFLIAFLTLLSVTLSFSIRTVSILAMERYKGSFGVPARLEVNWEKLNRDHPVTETVNADGSITMEQNFEVPAPDPSEYASYAASPYVKQMLSHASCSVYSASLEQVDNHLPESYEITDVGGKSKEELMEFFQAATDEELYDIVGGKEALKRMMDTKPGAIGSLIGFTDLSLLEDFAKEYRKLEEGTFPAKEKECIISNQFARKNHLNVGDSISISGPSASMDQTELPFTIVGIYGDYFNAATGAELGMVYGDIFTTYDTLINSGFHYIDMLDAEFILHTPECVTLFEKELYEKGVSEYQKLVYSIEEYENCTEPLKNISHIAELFTLSASLIGMSIIFMIAFITIRERKYEIGVLRSMGMKKAGIARGMMYEIILLMIAAFLISTLAGSLLTKPITSLLLKDFTEAGTALPVASVLFSAAIASILSLISGLCAVFAIMRDEPVKILAERN